MRIDMPNAAAATAMVERCLAAVAAAPTRGVVKIDTSVEAYHDKIEHDLRPRGRFEALGEWNGKHVGRAARIAAILHMAMRAEVDNFLAETMSNAVQIAAYFADHMIAAYGLMHTDRRVILGRRPLDWVKRNHQSAFTARDGFTALASPFGNMSTFWKAADLLVEYGYLRIREPVTRTDGAPQGRKGSPLLEVHPTVHGIQNV